jgi:hypothetical protein
MLLRAQSLDIVPEGGLSRLPERHSCGCYTVAWTLWKVETTVSNV